MADLDAIAKDLSPETATAYLRTESVNNDINDLSAHVIASICPYCRI